MASIIDEVFAREGEIDPDFHGINQCRAGSMTWEIAHSQVVTSKKPKIGASDFMPRDTKIMRKVPKVTTANSARKILIRRKINMAASWLINPSMFRLQRGRAGANRMRFGEEAGFTWKAVANQGQNYSPSRLRLPR